MVGIAQRRKRPRRLWNLVLVALVLAAVVVALVSFGTPQQSSDSAVHQSVRRMKKPRPIVVEVDDLEHEGLFRKAATKSCLPSQDKKCGEYIPDAIVGGSSPSKVQRIVLLAPPGHLSGALGNRIEQIVKEHNQQLPGQIPMQLIQTTHVPPYGYGKTHGYTKIIRLIPEPLLLEVADALSGILHPGESHTAFTVADVTAALRMVLRFHCRLSHVAAHTALLSIKFLDLYADPIGTTQRIRAFLSPGLQSKQNAANGTALTDDAEAAAIDDDQASLMDAELSYGSQLLTYVQVHGLDGGRTNRTVGRGILDVLDQVLLEEFRQTKDMTVWPCPSFWSSPPGEPALSALARRLAQKLSPDCNDPYNTCFVPRDKCEFQGDALCSKEESKQK